MKTREIAEKVATWMMFAITLVAMAAVILFVSYAIIILPITQ